MVCHIWTSEIKEKSVKHEFYIYKNEPSEIKNKLIHSQIKKKEKKIEFVVNIPV